MLISPPLQSHAEGPDAAVLQSPVARRAEAAWQRALPTLHGLRLTLRELRKEDAPSLLAQLSSDEVTRFISPPPTTAEGFEQFIAWAQRRRQQGRYACFAVVPEGGAHAVGMFQLHILDADERRAEWGFVLGSAYWGKGLFLEGAFLMLQFIFETVGIDLLEARSCVGNGRGNGALRKVGARQQVRLRRAFAKNGRRHDQWLWTIVPKQWTAFLQPRSRSVH
jgi:RimJ/RimL family protein N-acetyltransferase